MYARYGYVIEKKDPKATVESFAGVKRRLMTGKYLLLGHWYAHEKTPYRVGNRIVRDYYNEEIVLAVFIEGEWREV